MGLPRPICWLAQAVRDAHPGLRGVFAVRPGGVRRLVTAKWGDAGARSRLGALYAAIPPRRWVSPGSRRRIMLTRLERALERIVEGSIAGVFRLRVQPAEIGRRLERAMLDGRVTSVGTSLAPNLYEVRLHPEDAAAFTGWEQALSREMETWLAEFAFARGLSTVGPIQVHLVEDTSVGRRSVQAEGRLDARV